MDSFRALLITVLVLALGIVVGGCALLPPVLEVPSQGLVLSDVTIVNPGLDRRSRQPLTVQGSKIDRISDSDASPPEATSTRRFAGTYVLPGMIDMHVHFPSSPNRDLFALLFLAHGVTTVRDTGR